MIALILASGLLGIFGLGFLFIKEPIVGLVLLVFSGYCLWSINNITNELKSGEVGIESMMDHHKIYVLMGTPASSSLPKHRIVTVHSGDGDQSFAVGAFPPAGFKVTKTDDGKTLLVPDENKARE